MTKYVIKGLVEVEIYTEGGSEQEAQNNAFTLLNTSDEHGYVNDIRFVGQAKFIECEVDPNA